MSKYNVLTLGIFLIFILFSGNAQELRIKSGFWNVKYFKDDERIDKHKFVEILSTNNKALGNWEKAKRQDSWFWIFGGAETGFLIWELAESGNYKKMLIPAIGGTSCFIMATIFFIESNKSISKAVKNYNENANMSTSFKLIVSDNGIGLALRF